MNLAKAFVFVPLVGVGAGVLFFAPGPQREVPPGRVVVTYWEKWTAHEAEQMKQIVDDFNRTVGAEKGIFVEYTSISSVDRKTLVATAAGVPPDVAGIWDGQIPQFAALEALTPLDDLARSRGITRETYKPVYWEGCTFQGRLWGLVSTPWAVALHWNKAIFQERAGALRAAGLDPDRPPRTLEELDRYAQVLDQREPSGRIVRTGYLPMEPGWFVLHTPFWFGGNLFDVQGQRFTMTDPGVVRAFEWIEAYSRRLGADSITDFRSGFGQFNSTQNPFLVGQVAMVQQGPWMANYMERLKPSMNRWWVSRAADPDQRRREEEAWKAAETRLPLDERRAHYQWGAAPFPSADGRPNVTFAGFDVLVIPRTARHKAEAFEFVAYVNRQEVMEKLCALHCKNSPLRRVSEPFIREHPNPYIGVFEEMVSGPNAYPIPRTPIWPEVGDEILVVGQQVSLGKQSARAALERAQERLAGKYSRFLERQRARRAAAEGRP